MLFGSNKSNYSTPCNKNNIQDILKTCQIAECAITILRTFIFVTGTRVSATRDRKFGSIFRHCNDDMVIVGSHSRLCKSEWRKGSAPEKQFNN
jgi:hypothetical protein